MKIKLLSIFNSLVFLLIGFSVNAQLSVNTLSPADNSVNVSLNPTLSISYNFNLALPAHNNSNLLTLHRSDDGSVVMTVTFTKSGISVSPGGSAVLSGNSIIITPPQLLPNTNYHVLMYAECVKNITPPGPVRYNTAITDPTYWNFTTISPSTTPVLVSLYPDNNANDIDEGYVYLYGLFDRSIELGTGTVSLYRSTGELIKVYNQLSPELTVAGSGFEIFDETIQLLTGSSYYVLVSSGLFVNGTSSFPGLSNTTDWTFTTRMGISSYNPLPGSTNVALNQNLQLTFTNNIAFGSSGSFRIMNSNGTEFASYGVSSSNVSVSGATLTVTHSDFIEGREYYVMMDPGFVVRSATGFAFEGINDVNQWRFTTITNAPITTFNPVDGTAGISLYPTVEVIFNKPVRFIDGAAITAANVKDLIVSFASTSLPSHTLTINDFDAVINATSTMVTITLRNPLLSFYDYQLVIARVEDMLGIEQLSNSQTTFTTSYYNIWGGATDNSWANLSNWTNTFISNAGVIIGGGSPNYPVIDSDITLPHLIMEPGAQLTLNAGRTLTVNRTFEIIASNGDDGQPSFMNNGNLVIGGTGRINIRQRVSNSSYAYYFASPVNNATVNLTSRVYQRLYSPYSWQLLSNPVLNAAQGYAGYNTGGADIVLTGTSFNSTGSDYLVPTVRNSSNFGWHLAGNPYPTAIEWSDLTISNLKNHFYIRRNETVGYGIYNGALGVGVNLDGVESQIPPLHGFYIQTASGVSSGLLTIPAASRRLGSTNYLKSSSLVTDKVVVKLVTKFNGFKDEVAIVFKEGGSFVVTDADSEKMLSTSNDVLDIFALSSNNTKLGIKVFPKLNDATMIVPIGYDAPQTGSFAIAAKSLATVPDGYSLMLEDVTKGVMHSFANGDYNFSITAKGVNNTRFKVHLVKNVTTDVAKVTTARFFFYHEKGIVFARGNATQGRFEMYDVNGTQLANGELSDLLNKGVKVQKTGVYLVKVFTANAQSAPFVAKVLVSTL